MSGISSGAENLRKNLPYLKTLRALSPKTKIYLVGGAVRDIMAGEYPSDFDFAVDGRPAALARKFADKTNGSFVVLDKERGVYRVVKKTVGGVLTFDFSAIRGKTIEDDLKIRDITINAMAIKLKDVCEAPGAADKIIDPARGMADIKKRRIAFISEKALREDPARILRAFRFAAETGFALPRKTLSTAKRLRRLATRPSAERLRDELMKTFASDGASVAVAGLDKCGLMEQLLPEISAMKKSCKSFYFHPDGLWHHLTETLARLEEYAAAINRDFPETPDELAAYLARPLSSGTVKSLLKFTALLHDAGKPVCARRIGKRMRFFGHETLGVGIFNGVAARFKLSREESAFAQSLIRNHMRILQLVGAGKISERAVYRLRRDAGATFPALCLLSLSDAASYKNLKGFEKNNVAVVHKFVRGALKNYFEDARRPPAVKIIDGHILMRRLKVKPGPELGAILKRLEEERSLGNIKTTDEAVECARKLLKNSEEQPGRTK